MTFTTTAKHKLSWNAAPVAYVDVDADVFFKIDDTHNLIIGDTYKLIITPGNVDVLWTGAEKNRLAWVETGSTIDNAELLIDDTHRLLIANGYSLIIDPANSGTEWEPVNKTR